MSRWSTRLIVAAALGAVVVLGGPGTAAAQSCLIEVVGDDSVELHGIVPGGSRAWTATVRNVSDDPVALSVDVQGSGALAPGLELSVERCDVAWTGPHGGPLVCPASASVVTGAHTLSTPLAVDLGDLDPGEHWRGALVAALPLHAGNEFQGAGGSVAAVFSATGPRTTCSVPDPEPADDPDDGDDGDPTPRSDPDRSPPDGVPPGDRDPDGPGLPGRLPFTGATVRPALALGVVLVGAGVALRRRR